MHLFPTRRPALQEHKSRSLFWKKALLVGLGTGLLALTTLSAQTPQGGNLYERPVKTITHQSKKAPKPAKKPSQLNRAKFCDLAQLCQSRVVYFGDVHTNADIRRELMAQLPELKKAGFTHLAVEMEQKDLVNYAEDLRKAKTVDTILNLIETNQPIAKGSKAAKLKDFLELFKGTEFIQKFRELTAVYLTQYELVDSANRLGFTVVAADSLGDLDDKLTSLIGKAMGMTAVKSANTDSLIHDDLKGYDDIGPRNRYIARKVSEVLADPKNRVLAIFGEAHVVKSGIPALVSKMSGESGPTIIFSYSGALQTMYSEDNLTDQSVPLEVSARKWNTQRFALPADAVGKGTECDWYFHLPEKTK